MRSNRRLAQLEASLSPTQATLLWLADAHGFDSLCAYATSLVEQPTAMSPLVAVPQQARRAVRGVCGAGVRRALSDKAPLG